MAGLELNQHVEIAVGAKVRAECGTKNGEATDAAAVAVFREALKVYVEWQNEHGGLHSIRDVFATQQQCVPG